MQLQYISTEDWERFQREHHSAYHFLLRASLAGERKALVKELPTAAEKRQTWIRSRLQSFDEIDAAFPSLPPIGTED